MDLDPKYDHYDFPYEAKDPQNGHAGHLTEAQIAQVHQLRMMLEAEGVTDRLDTLTMVRSSAELAAFRRSRQLGTRATLLLTFACSCASSVPASSMSRSPSRCT